MSILAKRLDGSIYMSLGTEVGLGPGHTVLDGDPASPRKRTQQPPLFSSYVYYGQTAGWIRIPLGMEVGLGSGDIVLHYAQKLPLFVSLL